MIEKASIAMINCSGLQEIFLSVWRFMQLAKRSNIRLPNIYETF